MAHSYADNHWNELFTTKSWNDSKVYQYWPKNWKLDNNRCGMNQCHSGKTVTAQRPVCARRIPHVSHSHTHGIKRQWKKIIADPLAHPPHKLVMRRWISRIATICFNSCLLGLWFGRGFISSQQKCNFLSNDPCYFSKEIVVTWCHGEVTKSGSYDSLHLLHRCVIYYRCDSQWKCCGLSSSNSCR